ncbi:MAG: hypothetical protein ABSH47_26325, partial [Bryobacteraceae bacterium]
IEQIVGLADPANADSALAAALINNATGPLITLQRYAAAIERSGYRALQQLLALRKLETQAARDTARRNEANSAVSSDANSKTRNEFPHREAAEDNPPRVWESPVIPHPPLNAP